MTDETSLRADIKRLATTLLEARQVTGDILKNYQQEKIALEALLTAEISKLSLLKNQHQQQLHITKKMVTDIHHQTARKKKQLRQKLESK